MPLNNGSKTKNITFILQTNEIFTICFGLNVFEKIKMRKDVTIIIRSAGERTVEYCRYLLSQQAPEKNIVTIEETPFSSALIKGFQIGIEKGLEWTLCIDADVLITDGIVSKMLEYAKTTEENIFEIQGLVIDKFFPIMRPAGNHLYRTSLMHKAMSCIPEEGTSLRPETDMLDRMIEIGYPWEQIDLLIGLHDFKQYYKDIYRKCFLQVHKHQRFMPLAEKYWRSKASIDKDFEVALWGSTSGKIYDKTVYVDKYFLKREALAVLTLKNTKEKYLLLAENYKESYIKEVIKKYNNKDVFVAEFQDEMFPLKMWKKINTSSSQKKTSYKMSIFPRNMLYRSGIIMEKIGKKLQTIASLK